MNERRILVPDATNRPALTAIRSLGSHGCEVFAGATEAWSLGGASRYVAGTIRHPDPGADPRGFVGLVAEHVQRHDIGVVMPAADVPTSALIEYEDLLPATVALLVPPRDALALAHDKIELVKLARRVEVPVPEGFEAGKDPLDDPRISSLGFPLVLKPRSSRYQRDGRWAAAGVKIVEDLEDMKSVLKTCPEFQAQQFLVQRKVPGEGRGVFLLAHDGELICVFAHRRIREKPPRGGVSTLCETATPEPVLVEFSRRLIAALQWTGVAMVEFKWNPETSEAWLIEINGRFWGSMQLAVASGIDFPWLFYRMAVLGESVEASPEVRNCRLWWLLGDADHFLLRIRHGGIRGLGAALADLIRTRQGRHLDLDTLKGNDPIPFLFELRERIRDGMRHLVRSISRHHR
jgi:predicted ATP-grasp superfamily ATP-dependent carboligase